MGRFRGPGPIAVVIAAGWMLAVFASYIVLNVREVWPTVRDVLPWS